jgi:hypothetical protein
MTTKSAEDDQDTEVFDVAHWLDRATSNRPAVVSDYVPKHRAEVPPV